MQQEKMSFQIAVRLERFRAKIAFHVAVLERKHRCHSDENDKSNEQMVTYMSSGKFFIATEANSAIFFMIYVDIGIVVFVLVGDLVEWHVTANILVLSQHLQYYLMDF